jgi:hypothetical protein
LPLRFSLRVDNLNIETKQRRDERHENKRS